MLLNISKSILKKNIIPNSLRARPFSKLIDSSRQFRSADDTLEGNDTYFKVQNPATLETLCYLQDNTIKDCKEAIHIAYDTFVDKEYKHWPTQKRHDLLIKFHDLVMENLEELAKLCTLENGKSLNESRGEVKYGASFLQWFAEEAVRIYGDVIPAPIPGNRLLVIKQPVGVVGIITPWNFPIAMITRKLGAALAAGCTAVIKPAADTPLSALALQKLAIEAGFPEGAVNVVTTEKHTKAIGKELCLSSKVSKISFTGSTPIGKILTADAGSTMKKVSMELGGNAPFIVFDDADIDVAVAGAIAAKFRNAGQTCVSGNRFIVHSKVHDQFAEKLARVMEETLKVGNGLEDGVNVGPLINKKGMEKVLRHILNAQALGAQLVTGGNRIGTEGTFIQPTLLTNLNTTMDIHCEETFGPVVAISKFDDEADAVKLANSTEMGLASYFHSNDISRIWRVAEQLQSGMVSVNAGSISQSCTPFGGIKQSGIGVEGSKYGIDEYLNKKLISIGISS